VSKRTSQITELETAIKRGNCVIDDSGSLLQGLDAKMIELFSKFAEVDTKVSEMGRQVDELHTRVSDIDEPNSIEKLGK
jgi:chromosome segregation ATPase